MFVKGRLPLFYQNYPTTTSEKQILDSVVDESLFGAVQVDIEVPKSWDDVSYKPSTDLEPAEFV